ncbi:NADPH:quinone reductase [Actinocatenispora thailandica]|uniref:NADPH:quinone reductase n=1 Tax=Actinocatenispora thailandica TaxID=227318 RepID=A0A7R7DRT1_9ACTN|nr:NADP-dependent oxidoreductase [Actinocatenispora thailandica]BCJ36440.1 NADPH:quinone reductase [Actinocatenispora thailandica]
MKAVRFHRYGDSDVLAYEDAPRPVPAAGQVLVQVAATTFNPVDASIRAGRLAEVFPVEFPHVPGVEVAGTVAELGADVTGQQVGAAVLAYLPMTADGAAAEHVLAPAEALAAAPRTVPLADAAALPAAALTAWQALTEVAGLTTGQRILVNGAGGAVGGYAVQLAKQLGAEVTATGSDRSADRLREYGADRIVGYVEGSAPVTGAPFDVVLNLVPTSPEQSAVLVGLVADGGVLVSATAPADPDPARQVRTAQVFSRSDAAQLAELVARVDAGTLRIDVADRRPLADLPAVHADYAAGRLAGRTILIPA